MYRFSYILTILLCSLCAKSQTNDEKQVITVIQTFFEAMKEGDHLKLKGTLEPDCSLKSIVINKDSGLAEVRNESMDKFVEAISNKDPNTIYDERISLYDIKIDGPMAMAWTPYKFYLNKTFSHCGVNVFSLIKRENSYTIISIMDTRRKSKCL